MEEASNAPSIRDLTKEQVAQELLAGTGGMDGAALVAALERGARFYVYEYCVSYVVGTSKRSSCVYFLSTRTGRTVVELTFSIISLLLGIWGFPCGPIYALQAVTKNLRGGTDVTVEVLASLRARAAESSYQDAAHSED